LVRVLPQTKAFRTTVCSEVKMAGAWIVPTSGVPS
jgi:hypothetical protein